jgi:hypothetical protein
MKLRTMLTAAGLSLGTLAPVGVVATAPPATAAGTCPRSYVCMWEDSGFNGSRYVKQYKTSGYYDIHWWDGDNEITSVKNYTGKCVRLYANDDHGGPSYVIDKNVTSIVNLKENGFNDEAESYRIYSC